MHLSTAMAARVASGLGASSTSRPVPPSRPQRHVVPSAVSTPADAAQLAACVATGAALLNAAWPTIEHELRPIRCARCRGMGWTVCANCKGRGKTGCPPLLYATIERRPKRGRSTEGRGDGDGDDRDADAISADGSCDGVMIANDGPPRPREDAPRTCDDPSPSIQRLSYCRECGGKGRCGCEACARTGVENNWLFRPARKGGWGARGSWRDPANPPPPPPPP